MNRTIFHIMFNSGKLFIEYENELNKNDFIHYFINCGYEIGCIFSEYICISSSFSKKRITGSNKLPDKLIISFEEFKTIVSTATPLPPHLTHERYMEIVEKFII